ncbi:hypothetical protein HU200_021968 [Digitaria exilis]|uniref:Cytochrome P450 n=1 Tax=Digitaria exilis TaxID=1010633 RepID=A0A835EVH4_9POAL|nr:hypothetical protein HU200_021968 [Digitaria exilis]
MANIYMELLQDQLMSWVFSLAFILLLQLWGQSKSAPLPPGPKPLLIIGNMLMMHHLTHRGLVALADNHGGLVHLRLGHVHAFAVSTPEHAREVLQAQDLAFANLPATAAVAYLTYGRADMAFAHYGAFWRKARRLSSTKLFSRRRAETWLAMRDECAALVRAVATRSSAGEVVNVGELIFDLTKNAIYRAAFGTRDGERQAEFIAILQEFSQLLGAFNVGDFIPWLSWIDPRGINRRLRVARAALDRFIDKIIDEHIKRGKSPNDAGSDMVDEMLAYLAADELNTTDCSSKASAGGGDDQENILRLTRNNIKGIIMDMMFGGTETVASGIEWAMVEMVRSPDELRRLQQKLADVVGLDRNVDESDLGNLPFLKCVVKETLRLHPPIPLLLHETATDCVLGGYSVPKGSRVMVNVWALGRDRATWKDPGAFRPSRFAPGGEAAGFDVKGGGSFEYIPYGSGRRACPGMALGQYALELAVAQLAHGFEWALPEGVEASELDMADVFGLAAPRVSRFHAVATPRLTCPLY